MKFSKSILSLMAFLVSTNLLAGTFTIHPYTLRKENGESIVKFQVYEDRKLQFVIQHDGENGIIERTEKQYFHKDILHSLNLGKQDCNAMIKLQIEDITDDKDVVVLENTFHYVPCDPNEPIRFGFLSDTQKAEGNEAHAAIAKHVSKYIEEKGLSFVLNAGDVVHVASEHDQWMEYLQTSLPYASKVPVIAALGNHGYRGEEQEHGMPPSFNKYMRWKDAPFFGNLSYSFPQFNLIVFNSNDKEMLDEDMAEQKAWLKNELEKAKQAGKMVAVMFHHAPITSTLGVFSKDVKYMKKHVLKKIIDKYKNVKLILAGHTHVYERSWRKKAMHVVAGTASGKAGKTWMWNRYKKYRHKKANTFSFFEVTNSNIKMDTYDSNNKLLDSFDLDY